MTQERLQKFLSRAGLCSRRKGEEYILRGLIRINGEVVRTLGTKIDPDKDRVEFRGKPVAAQETPLYIALHKPKGYVSSCRHPGEKLVLDLIDLPQRIYPVGRLDKDSTGLILLTNNGRLHHTLSHPSFDHEREYEVETVRPIGDEALRSMEKGILLGKTRTRPARVERFSGRRFKIILKEGRNRQIRRMVKQTGHEVRALKRIRIAEIRLGRLKPGEWRHLTPREIEKLLPSGIRSLPG